MKKYFFWLLILFSILSHSFDYGDQITISVYNKWGLEEFSDTFTVSQDQTISLPFIGELKVKDNNVTDLKQLIFDELNPDIFINPVISIKTDGNIYSISGMVKKSGVFRFDKKIFLSDIIETSGGLKDGADTYDIRIKRDEKIFNIDYDLFLKGNKDSNNPQIKNNDNIFIKELGFVYVLGEVKEPFKTYFDRDTDVLDLVLAAKAGDRAALRFSRIIRMNKDGKFAQVPIDLKKVLKEGNKENLPSIKPGDVIFIPKNQGSKLDVFDLSIGKITSIMNDINLIKFLRKELF